LTENEISFYILGFLMGLKKGRIAVKKYIISMSNGKIADILCHEIRMGT
jgi:hypothetical protein